MSQLKRARYTLEFKLEAVRLVKASQSLAAVSAILGYCQVAVGGVEYDGA
jgi:transposase